MKNFTYSFLLLFITAAFVSSCKKEKNAEPAKEPVYTTVSLKFTNKVDANDVQTITYKDLDNEGPLLPTFSTLKLKQYAEYAVEVVEVKDENISPATDFLSVIKSDSRNYLFVYGVFQANLGFSTTNFDSDNKRFGTQARANTGIKSNGNFIFKLVANPVSKDNADAAGNVKFQYTFPVEIN